MHNLVRMAADLLLCVDILVLFITTLCVQKWWLKVASLVAGLAAFKVITHVDHAYGALWALEAGLIIFIAVVVTSVAVSE